MEDSYVKSCTTDRPQQLTLARTGVCGHESATVLFFLLDLVKEESGLEASKACWLQASIKGTQAVLKQKVPLTKLSKKRAGTYCPMSRQHVRAYLSL